MCGRFTLASDIDKFLEAIGLDFPEQLAHPRRYNIAPSQPVVGIVADPHPRVEVTVEGLRNTKGDVVVEIYPDAAKGFLTSRTRLGRTRAKAEPGVRVCIPAPAAGWYAVVAYHDEDGDRHFSKNFLGLPSEGFGVSNNPPPALGKPSFSKVRFQVGEGETQTRIRIRYGLGGGTSGGDD